MPGIMGQFMKFLPITVMVTLSGSLFVAFVFNPVFASMFMNKNEKGLEDGEGDSFERFRKFYRRALNRAVDHPKTAIAFCAFFVVSGVMTYGVVGPGVVFFPNIEPKVVSVEITGPLGIGINSTDSALRVLEEKILNVPEDKADIVSVST